MNILFIAPLFDNVNGMSLASEILLEYLQKSHHVKIINLRKKKWMIGTFGYFIRVFEVFGILWRLWRAKKECDVIYFTISQSYLGNLKDLLMLFFCYKLLPRTVVHLHGGPGMHRILLSDHTLLIKLNLFLLNKVGGIVILGERHLDIYRNVKHKEKIHIVSNFAKSELLVTQEIIKNKFDQLNPLKILIVSNALPGKGHLEILEAFLLLDEKVKELVQIDFAGDLVSKEFKKALDEAIYQYPQLHYCGIVDGEKKRALFSQAHVFCLPSYYRYEGQPISILEAYASGCVVVTTNHSGIFDIFTPGKNGFEVVKKSSDSIAAVINKMVECCPQSLYQIAEYNFSQALNFYTENIYNQNLLTLLTKVAGR